MNTLQKYILGATLILATVAIGVATFKGGEVKLSDNQLEKLVSAIENASGMDLGAVGTRFPNGIAVGGNISPNAGEFLSTGTTTLTRSVDGLVVGGTISTAATGTVRTLDTNTTGPKVCDLSTSHLTVRNKGSFSPILGFSVGTSTSAIAATNIMASTTIATSTPGTTFLTSIAPAATAVFAYNQGDVLTAIMGDGTSQGSAGGASSTNYANLTVEFGMWCTNLSI